MAFPNLFLFNTSSSPSSATEVHVNGTPAPLCTDWPPLPINTVIPTIYSIICMLGTIANALAMFVLTCGNNSRRTVADIFMLNLCTSDMLFLLSLPLWAVYYSWGYSWPFGQAACKICGAILNLNLYASIFFIACMSMDRYLAIVHPLRSLSARDTKHACFLCILVWILACACSSPNLALRNIVHLEGLDVDACVITYPGRSWFLALVLMKILLGFLLPLLAISCCYCAIGRHLWAHRGLVNMQPPSHLPNMPSQEGHRQPEQPPTFIASSGESRSQVTRRVERILWTVAAVVLAFFLCWFPFYFVTFIYVLNSEGWLDGCTITWTLNNLTPLTLSLGFSNSAINPILYCFIGNHFRGRLGDLCKGLCACLKARGEEHSQKRGSFSTRLSSFSRKLSDLKDLAIVETPAHP